MFPVTKKSGYRALWVSHRVFFGAVILICFAFLKPGRQLGPFPTCY